MKINSKTMILFILSLTVAFALGVWFLSTIKPIGVFEYVLFVCVWILAIFGFQIAHERYESEKKGLTGEDELSSKIKVKAASKAFFGSLYMWTLFLVFNIDNRIETELIFGFGIVGMGLMYVMLHIYYNRVGLSSEIE